LTHVKSTAQENKLKLIARK